MTTKQVWLVPVSPAQRWILLALSHGAEQKIAAAESKPYRRFMRALGLTAIRDVLRVSKDRGVSAAMAQNDAPALFELTAETVDYVLGLAAKVSRSAADEDVIGDLFDLFEDLKAGREYEPPALERYSAAAETWAPPPEGDADDDKTAEGEGEAEADDDKTPAPPRRPPGQSGPTPNGLSQEEAPPAS